MARNRSHNPREVESKRREIVAALRLRRLTVRQIVAVMSKQPPPGFDGRWYFPNPQTGKPWSASVIARDFQHLDAEWRKNAETKAQDRHARRIAELQEARKRAWEKDDMPEVRHNLMSEAELFGDLSRVIEITGPNGGPVQVESIKVSERDVIRARLLARLGTRLGMPADSPNGAP